MEINKLSNVSGISRVKAVQQPKAETANTKISSNENVQSKQDVVNIQTTETTSASNVTFSGEKIDGIRTDLVNRVRAEIAAGVYETPEKLEIALEKLLSSFDN